RRRHTRWPRDWSSDVCSSDLEDRDENSGKGASGDEAGAVEHTGAHFRFLLDALHFIDKPFQGASDKDRKGGGEGKIDPDGEGERSEERRVGKEWRERGWAWE